MNNKTLYKIPAAFLSLTIFFGAWLATPSALADTISDTTVVVDVPSVCSLTVVNGTNNEESFQAQITPGSTGHIGTSKMKLVCNDYEGLALYAVGFTGDSYGENKLISSDSLESYIPTGTATSGNASAWNMTIANDNTVVGNMAATIVNATTGENPVGNFGAPHEIPNIYTKVAYRDAGTDVGTNPTGSNVTAAFDAYISPTQPAGDYHGKVKFMLVHPNSKQAPDEFTGMLMQDVAQWGHKVQPGQTTRVIDSRDGTEYSVARLADGNLWMTQNLRLDLENANITAANTNNPAQDFLSEAALATANNDIWSSSDPWVEGGSASQIRYSTIALNDFTVDTTGHTHDEYGVYYNWYTATAGNGTLNTPSANTDAAGDICPSGWHLASGIRMNGSPSSWTGEYWELAATFSGIMPGTVQDSDYSTITSSGVLAQFTAAPNNFIYSGYYDDDVDGLSLIGEKGLYFSSTNGYGSYPAWGLEISSTITSALASTSKNYGYPIRCVANRQNRSLKVVYGTGVSSVSVDGVTVADGATVTLTEVTTHSITATLSSGYIFTGWSSTTGSVDDSSSASTAIRMGPTSGTLTANAV